MKTAIIALSALTLSMGSALANPGHAPEGTVMHSVQHGGGGWLLAAVMLLGLVAVGLGVKRAVQRGR